MREIQPVRAGALTAGEDRFRVDRWHQTLFAILNQLWLKAGQGRGAERMTAKLLLRGFSPVISRLLRSRPFVTARLHGHDLTMRMDHRAPQIQAFVPSFNEPLQLLAETLAAPGRAISVIDVGANIGDTVALIEKAIPHQARYLCVEPNPEFYKLCVHNLRSIPNVQIISALIGDRPGVEVELVEHRPGTASARISTQTDRSEEDGSRIVRLDSAASDWATAQGVDLLKCDTDGFDFPVIRSAAGLLDSYRPAILFEWHPDLWMKAGEDPVEVFEYLAQHGYRNLVFFTNRGPFFCCTSVFDNVLYEGLKNLCLARQPLDDFHFDVLAADEEVCRAVVQKSIGRLRQ